MRFTLLLSIILVSWGAEASIKSYFNNRTDASYQDPYRHITRHGDNLEEVIVQEMDKAKETLLVAIQEIRLPSIAKKMVEKFKEGVDVRIILENSYNHNILAQPNGSEDQLGDENSHESVRFRDLVLLIDINGDGKITREEMLQRDAMFILQQAKVPLIDDTADGSAGSGLMHHKFVIVDSKTVILSSANFTPSCIHGDIGVPASRGNPNALMVVNSRPLARIFNEEFQILWSAKFGLQKPFRGAKTITVGGKKLTVQFSPTSQKVNWDLSTNGLIAKQIRSARSSIQAALFVFSEQGLSNAMEKVSHRAKIEVLVERKFAFRYFSEVLDLLGVELPDFRCVVNENNAPWSNPIERAGTMSNRNGDVLHHKFGVVDNRKTIFGSHNWSNAANTSNDEFVIVLDDSATAQEFSDEFSRLATRAQWGIPYRIEQEIERMSEFCAPISY